MRISTPRSALFVAAPLVALMPVDLAAKNLDLLTRLLILGYIAQDFAALCSDYDPGFLPGVRNGSAGVAAYAQHLKIEVTVGLTQAEAVDVMRVATFVIALALSASVTLVRTATANGEVKKIDQSADKITIQHGPIKAFDMENPMTMVYHVKDPAMLKQAKVGEKVQFDVDHANGQFTATKIEKAK